jgi:hypothetical protein
MEYGKYHPPNQPWLKVETQANCYVLTVQNDQYAYYDVKDLVLGIIVHGLVGLKTAINLDSIKAEVDILSLVPVIRELVKEIAEHIFYFKFER